MSKDARENDSVIDTLLKWGDKYQKEIIVLREQIKEQQDKFDIYRENYERDRKEQQERFDREKKEQQDKFEREKLELEKKCEMKFERERELLNQLIINQNNQINTQYNLIVELKDENKQLKEEIERLSRQKPGIQIDNEKITSESLENNILKNREEFKKEQKRKKHTSNEPEKDQSKFKMFQKSDTIFIKTFLISRFF